MSVGIGIGAHMGCGPASDYESETSAYMAASGANNSVTVALNAWIKGLKALGAWNTARMWILRDSYHVAGTTVYGLGGAGGINATLSGTVSRTTTEFYFTGASSMAKITGTNLMPLTPSGSFMMVGRNPQFFQQYGAGFGGEYNKVGMNMYAGWSLTDGSSGTAILYVGTDINGGAGGLPSAIRMSSLLTITGEQSGTSSVNGAAPGAGTAGGKNYTLFSRSSDTIVAGNPYIASPGDSAYSFVCIWTNNQSANSAAIYALFKATIGAGLSLP